MYTSKDINMLFKSMAATQSKNEKISILSNHSKCENTKRILSLGLNKSIRFHIIPTSEWTEHLSYDSGNNFNDDTYMLLDNISSRKITGHAARDEILKHINTLNKDSAELLVKILRKDFNAGFSYNTVEKVFKGTLPKIPYNRCSLLKDCKFTEHDWENGIYIQQKMDGMFASPFIADGNVTIFSRQGSVFEKDDFSELYSEIINFGFENCMVNGEILIMQDGQVLPRKIGNGIINSISKGEYKLKENQSLKFVVWDIVDIDEAIPKGKSKKEYKDRFNELSLLESVYLGSMIEVAETHVVHSLKEAISKTVEMYKLGLEGSVIKHPKMIWQDGTSKNQIKLKVDFECDLMISEVVYGKPDTKYHNLPVTFSCESSDKKVKVDITIKNDKLRKQVNSNPAEFVGKVITVIANEICSSKSKVEGEYSLYLPRMAEESYRIDANTADDYEHIKKSYESALEGN